MGISHSLSIPRRGLAALAALALLGACNAAGDLDEPTVPLGNFRLGHNIVVAENAYHGPLSREATAEEWEEVIGEEMARRFDRFEGDRLYHVSIGVEGYILAMPGIPVVASPKSALIFSVTVWDDAAGGPLNRPHRLTAIESASPGTLVSSGLAMTREEQMQDLAQTAARQAEDWMRSNIEWFERSPEEAAAAVLPIEAAGQTPTGGAVAPVDAARQGS